VKHFAAACVLVVGLGGCANDPSLFQQHMNNAVDDVHIVGVGTVSIVTDVVKAVLSILTPITSILSAVGVHATP